VALLTIQPICRDPDDDKVVATAIAGEVDYLVTEDNDLLTAEVSSILEQEGIQTISVNEFIKQLG
jgi:predicted nucleic acid-binding protein